MASSQETFPSGAPRQMSATPASARAVAPSVVAHAVAPLVTTSSAAVVSPVAVVSASGEPASVESSAVDDPADLWQLPPPPLAVQGSHGQATKTTARVSVPNGAGKRTRRASRNVSARIQDILNSHNVHIPGTPVRDLNPLPPPRPVDREIAQAYDYAARHLDFFDIDAFAEKEEEEEETRREMERWNDPDYPEELVMREILELFDKDADF